MSGTDERIPLEVGQRFGHGQYFELDVIGLDDGVYPHIITGEATMTLPWRYATDLIIEVCLLVQSRADTGGSEIIKVSGGYNGSRTPEEAALVHTANKLGLMPNERQIVFWRECLGVGPQYRFPIWFSFLQNPVTLGEPTQEGCKRRWMSLEEACQIATARNTQFFDDFSTSMLLVLHMWHEKIAKLGR